MQITASSASHTQSAQQYTEVQTGASGGARGCEGVAVGGAVGVANGWESRLCPVLHSRKQPDVQLSSSPVIETLTCLRTLTVYAGNSDFIVGGALLFGVARRGLAWRRPASPGVAWRGVACSLHRASIPESFMRYIPGTFFRSWSRRRVICMRTDFCRTPAYIPSASARLPNSEQRGSDREAGGGGSC